jgi:phage gpG-like protein
MKEIGELSVTSIKKSFQEGGRFSTPDSILGGSNSWRPSFRATLEGGQTLRDTSRLHNSISYSADSNGVDITSGAVYSAIHQFGGRITAQNAPFLRFRLANGAFVAKRSVDIPARPFMNFQKEDLEEFKEVITDHILGQ